MNSNPNGDSAITNPETGDSTTDSNDHSKTVSSLVLELADDSNVSHQSLFTDKSDKVLDLTSEDADVRRELAEGLGIDAAERCQSNESFLRIFDVLLRSVYIECAAEPGRDEYTQLVLPLIESLCHLVVRRIMVDVDNHGRELDYDFAVSESLAFLHDAGTMFTEEFDASQDASRMAENVAMDVLSMIFEDRTTEVEPNALQRYYFAPALVFFNSFAQGETRKEVVSGLASCLLSSSSGEESGHHSTANPFEVQLCTPVLASLSQEEFDTVIAPKLRFKLLSDADSTTITIFAIARVLVDSSAETGDCKVDLFPHFEHKTKLMPAAVRQLLSSDASLRGLGSDLLVALITASGSSVTGRNEEAIFAAVRVGMTHLIDSIKKEDDDLVIGTKEQMESILLSVGEVGKTYLELKNSVSPEASIAGERHLAAYILDSVEDMGETSDFWKEKNVREAADFSLEQWELVMEQSDPNAPEEAKPYDLAPVETAAAVARAGRAPGNGNLQQMERDAIAKARAKRSPNAAPAAPGVVSMEKNNVSSNDPESTDSDVLAKARARNAQGSGGEETFAQNGEKRGMMEEAGNMVTTGARMQDAKMKMNEGEDYVGTYNASQGQSESNNLMGSAPGSMRNDTAKGESEALPTAVAIDPEDFEEEEEPVAAIATAWDPKTAIPNLLKNPKFIAGALCCLGAIVAIAIGVSLSVTRKVVNDAENQEPVCIKDKLGYFEPLLALSSEEDLCKIKTPQFYAYHWLAGVDERKVDPTDPELLQRYVLALIYFSTKGYNWATCGGRLNTTKCQFKCFTQAQCAADDRCQGDQCTADRYLSSSHECEWYGSKCDENKQIVDLDFLANNLDGTLPSEISKLSKLQRLSMPANFLQKTLPSTIGQLTSLELLNMKFNGMTGTVPEQLFQLTSLLSVDIGSNFFQGTLSPQWGSLAALRGLYLYNNTFGGPLPKEIGNMKDLGFFNIQRNELSGPIPQEYFSLTKLKQMVFDFNLLSGTVSSLIGNLQDLEILQLNNNKFSGELPEKIFDLPKLKYLYLHDNGFSGTLSTNVGQLVELERLILDGNNFEGEIPSELASLTKLKFAWMHYNDFTGAMPDSVCMLRDGALESLYVDCLGDSVECDSGCCTNCCHKTLRQCFESE